MTAYGAVISLQNTIHDIVSSSRISLVRPSLEILQLAYNELQPLQNILKRLDATRKSRSRKKVNALDQQIKERIWRFEDSLESILIGQILSQPGISREQVEKSVASSRSRRDERDVSLFSIGLNIGDDCDVHSFSQKLRYPSHQLELTSNIHTRRSFDHMSRVISGAVERSNRVGCTGDLLLFSIDLRWLQHDVHSFIQNLKDLEEQYIYEVDNMAEDDEASPSRIGFDFGGSKSKMIGLSDQFQEIKSYLMGPRPDLVGTKTKSHVFALGGMEGVGKTTLAKEIYQDPEILSRFDCHAWVTLGRRPQLNQLSQGILAQLCRATQGDENIDGYLEERLKGKNCLIVVDDVWEKEVLDSLINSLPDIGNGSFQFLATARWHHAVSTATTTAVCRYHVVRFLNEEESKELLCEKVFGEEGCPPQLDKAATKIAKHCEGLPLTIVTVADILLKSENRDPDYWDEVAEERNSVFTDAYDEISKVLFPSYDYLPQYLKMPFLFMGVFHRDYYFPASKFINMLTTEGWFLDVNRKDKYLNQSVWECLEALCSWRHLVLFKTKSICWDETLLHHCPYKSCRLHPSWRHVCRGEARRNKFYHVLNKLIDAEEELVRGQRGLCLENNILFGIKEFCNSVRSNCAYSTRSLLFYGPYHQYPIPINVGFMLLRELDALQLRFYTFPTEILTLVQLKYLALTCSAELPITISKLFNLRVLIIHPHMNIRRCRAPSYIPMQIWDMKELEHIEILGKSLVAPSHVTSLSKLSTLVGVNASICTILELSERIPFIKKLGFQVELMPNDDHNDLLSCLRCISTYTFLYTLKFSIINPVIKYGYVVPATPSSLMLPHSLKKLHLSGMGFPWEYMDVIGSLPSLEVLKLRSYAFRGSKWEAQEDSFGVLQFLLIEDSDLVQWKPRSGSFRDLDYLSMKHCYKLQEIHNWLPRKAIKIELVDCNPLALTCVKQFPRHITLHVTASYSFDEKPITINFERKGTEDTYEEDEERGRR